MQRRDELFETAKDHDITISNAKSKSDGNKVALHLLNPDLDALEEAIYEADHKGYNAIMIHSRQTWPYTVEEEKVVVDQKLLA